MKTHELTLEFVNSNFYNIGEVIYRKDGKKCTNYIDKNGYYKLWFNYKYYRTNRVLWILYNQQEIPESYVIDHIDGDPSNNSKNNLRLASQSQNQHNSKISKNNTTGIKGLRIYNYNGYEYYCCKICKNYKRITKNFPYTPSGLESAKKWLEEKRKELHGNFSRNN